MAVAGAHRFARDGDLDGTAVALPFEGLLILAHVSLSFVLECKADLRPSNYSEPRNDGDERSVELRAIAQGIADALPPTVEEVVVTGSVSRGVADDVSDIEMLIVTRGRARARRTASRSPPPVGSPTSGRGAGRACRRSVSRATATAPRSSSSGGRARTPRRRSTPIFAGDLSATADAIANGVALRTSGLLAQWQERLRHYPDELAGARIEDAALTWGGFAPAGLLTLVRPGERLALVERMVDDASRVVRIVFALNRVWQPTLKRLAERAATLAQKPERLAERIEEALTEPDPRRALLVMTELQLETVALAPDGPNIDRARKWLGDGREILLEDLRRR